MLSPVFCTAALVGRLLCGTGDNRADLGKYVQPFY
jgi:hypothetical protein